MSMKKPIKPLHPDALTLMPADDESMRCAEHTRSHEIDPVGSALDVDIVIVADIPLPWPKPVFGHDDLAGVEGTMQTPLGTVRLLAAVPGQAEDRALRLFVRSGEGTHTASLPWDGLFALLDLLAELRSGELPDLTALTDPVLLVCTQGSHDVCCGSDGAKFATVLELTRPDVTLLRVSHTGGHKFAPTAMTFPDGRMWANLDPDLTEAILDRGIEASEAARHCRGWWGAASGPAQAAERAVFASVGWEWESFEREVVELAVGHEHWIYRVAGGEVDVDVAVSVNRHLPTIACRADGGLPAKPAMEYSAKIL